MGSRYASCLSCLGATPFWPILGWMLYFPGAVLVVVGVSKIFFPFSSEFSVDGFASSVRESYGMVREVEGVVLGLAIFNFLLTERTIAFKLGLRYPGLGPPCYGRTIGSETGFAKFSSAFCKVYPLLTLMITWIAVLMGIIFGAFFIICASFLICIAAISKSGARENSLAVRHGETKAVDALVKLLNDPPLNAGVNVSSSELMSHIGQDPSAVITGAAYLIAGVVMINIAQAIFLSSFTVTYGSSDIAAAIQNRINERTSLLDPKSAPLTTHIAPLEADTASRCTIS